MAGQPGPSRGDAGVPGAWWWMPCAALASALAGFSSGLCLQCGSLPRAVAPGKCREGQGKLLQVRETVPGKTGRGTGVTLLEERKAQHGSSTKEDEDVSKEAIKVKVSKSKNQGLRAAEELKCCEL